MVSIELPTNEQLEQKFNELSHTDEIEKERAWFWSGIAAYCQLVSEAAAKRLGLIKQEAGTYQTRGGLIKKGGQDDSNND